MEKMTKEQALGLKIIDDLTYNVGLMLIATGIGVFGPIEDDTAVAIAGALGEILGDIGAEIISGEYFLEDE